MYLQHLHHSVFGVVDTNKVVSNEFKKTNSNVYLLRTKYTEDFIPDFDNLKNNYELVNKLVKFAFKFS